MKLTEELEGKLKKEGYYNLREIPERGVCGLREFIFTIGLCYGIDEYSYKGRWCYPKENVVEAFIAYETWKGEGDPKGSWIKYKGLGGEYSNPIINNDV